MYPTPLESSDVTICVDLLRILIEFINFAKETVMFRVTKLIKISVFVMSLEIEHKFLVKGNSYKSLSSHTVRISQGYLCRDPERTVRVRIKDDKGFLTIKGKNIGAVRAEFEYEIIYGDAEKLLSMCVPPILEKIRYIVPFEGHIWEVDEFLGDKAGLVTAEIELRSDDEEYLLPNFVGENVTGNPNYYNSNL